MTARTNMPIMHSKAIPCIRWSLIAGHQAQARHNHGQTLEQLAGRGGLGVCEAVAIIENRQWHRMDKDGAEAALLAWMESDHGKDAK